MFSLKNSSLLKLALLRTFNILTLAVFINFFCIFWAAGSSSWKQYRFRQFFLDVSNFSALETTASQRTRCYTDKTTAPNLPPNIIDLPCKHTARYVIVETTYDCPEDDPITGAMLEICEIEVYGKKNSSSNLMNQYNCNSDDSLRIFAKIMQRFTAVIIFQLYYECHQ